MTHQFRDKKQINRKKKVIISAIIVGSFLLLVFSGILPIFGKLFNNLGRPILRAKVAVKDSANNIDYNLKSKSFLINKIETLLKENLNMKISMINYKLLKNQNTSLKNILNRVSPDKDLVVVGILSKPSDSPYDTLIIDAGKNNTLRVGDKVYIDSTIPIGTVNKVYSHSSLVELYSNPGRVTHAVISSLDMNVDLIGRGGGNFAMSVPFKISIPKDTLVSLPGISNEVIAIVGGDITDTTDQNRKIILHAPVNIQNQNLVEVEK